MHDEADLITSFQLHVHQSTDLVPLHSKSDFPCAETRKQSSASNTCEDFECMTDCVLGKKDAPGQC
ncbi:hypothetical protein T4B_2261 [Trichinella pseudospiralis]|uniref:Uncharacterized protein n=2 Tax=Trichinella pseudospiralis TaxID=6337 RepID=A0A0V1JLP9_TRIPS|nr:hypothetical protein T4A_9410 [Trichinella pseudospiralis]KRY83698.1 hypothetical protein T4D_4495 [Trichinella pseudospiralis]KRZ23195.1 hypothetical protein T4B_2261 [Trichinella pseudospiralis]KRZ35509.1 hypothetical protein T4C_7501 [Trichinella pseudospiralis]